MIALKFYICWFCLLLSISTIGQNNNEKALDNAEREYERGNYEKSLQEIDTLKLKTEALAIKRLWLLSENYVELQFPEEDILQNLDSILSIDPLFTEDKYNLEMSSRVASRLQTFHVYPQWVINLNASRDFVLPIINKGQYICEECIIADDYSFSEPGYNININLAYHFKNQFGIETGIGYAASNYSRNIQSISGNDEYSVKYNERLQLIDIPFRYIIPLNKWRFRVGANYKYLIQSDAKIYHSYTNNLDEEITQQYTRDDLQKIRNRNLVFLGFNIDRKIFPAKDKSLWYLSVYLNAQVGLNSFISEKNRLSDIDFISDTYYTDDKVSMAVLGIGVRINYNAKYKIN